jgi:hypothetical protein
MLEFFGARNTFIEIFAFPAKVGAAVRKTPFYFKDMIGGYRIIKPAVGIVGTAEYILTLVLINQF